MVSITVSPDRSIYLNYPHYGKGRSCSAVKLRFMPVTWLLPPAGSAIFRARAAAENENLFKKKPTENPATFKRSGVLKPIAL